MSQEAVGSHGTAIKGTSVFGGDLAAKGNIYVGQLIAHDSDPDTGIFNFKMTKLQLRQAMLHSWT